MNLKGPHGASEDIAPFEVTALRQIMQQDKSITDNFWPGLSRPDCLVLAFSSDGTEPRPPLLSCLHPHPLSDTLPPCYSLARLPRLSSPSQPRRYISTSHLMTRLHIFLSSAKPSPPFPAFRRILWHFILFLVVSVRNDEFSRLTIICFSFPPRPQFILFLLFLALVFSSIPPSLTQYSPPPPCFPSAHSVTSSTFSSSPLPLGRARSTLGFLLR